MRERGGRGCRLQTAAAFPFLSFAARELALLSLSALLISACERPLTLDALRWHVLVRRDGLTVDALALAIEDRAGVPRSQQRLVCGGRQLRPGQELSASSVGARRSGDSALGDVVFVLM